MFCKNDLMAEIGSVTGHGLEGRSAKARGMLVKANGGSEGSEKAVAMALKYLAAHQLPDGSWGFEIGPCACSHKGTLTKCFTGATSMALLPFLGSGQTHTEGHEEVLVVIRFKDRDNHRVLQTDYYLSNAHPDTHVAEFARVAKAEHRIEECIQRAKSEAGLADYEVRNWKGWHHHQILSLIATWFLITEAKRGKMDTSNHRSTDPRRHQFNPPTHLSMRCSLPQSN